MPTKRCCCGPCQEFFEDFEGLSAASELEPDWEVCDDWADWSITGGVLTSTTTNAIVVLKHMFGNPYGILAMEIEAIAGAIYRVHVFYGTEVDACSGPSNTFCEIEFDATEPLDGTLRVYRDNDVVEEVEFNSPSADVLWNICVGDNTIETSTDSSETLFACGEQTNWWFALEGVTSGTAWDDVLYTDHWLHDQRCPRCSQACCFSGFNASIGAFNITISNIGENECDCLDSVEFTVYPDPEGQNSCGCLTTYKPVADITGPHTCFGGTTSDITVTLDCRFNDEIAIDIGIVPDDGFIGENHWTKTWPIGTAPTAITATDEALTLDPGDEQSCIYEFATITIEPVVVSGCCDNGAEPMAFTLRTTSREMAISEHPAFLETLRLHKSDTDAGAGDTALRLLADRSHKPLYPELRRFLRLWSCKRKEAAAMANRWYPY